MVMRHARMLPAFLGAALALIAGSAAAQSRRGRGASAQRHPTGRILARFPEGQYKVKGG